MTERDPQRVNALSKGFIYSQFTQWKIKHEVSNCQTPGGYVSVGGVGGSEKHISRNFSCQTPPPQHADIFSRANSPSSAKLAKDVFEGQWLLEANGNSEISELE